MNHKWYSLSCTDCGTTIAFSIDRLPQIDIKFRCYLCAHSYAKVATWMMPIANGLSTNSLYGVNKVGKTLSLQFDILWTKLYAKLEAYRVDKANKKLHASKILLDKM